MKLSTKHLGWVLTLVLPALTSGQSQAQPITPELGSDGINTVITPQGNRFDITGGTPAGANLFHSFQKFGLNSDQTANFISNPTIQNILGRVVGGNPSVINGLIQVTGGNSNLYLMNPAGIIFGANASLNVPGDFTATTATGIGFDENWFNAADANDYAALVGTPNGFAFPTNQPGAIANTGNLAVEPGKNLTLLGGTVINTGTVSAPGGQITILAVPGENVVRITQEGQLLSLDLPSVGSRNLGVDTEVPNPLPFTPLSLPELLTSSNLEQATGIQVNSDGSVQLVSSGTRVIPAAGMAIASGNLNTSSSTAGTTGGTVQVLGNKVAVLNGTINTSGANGGGTILVGGNYQGEGTLPNAQHTHVSADSTLRADALTAGNGGTAIIWADGTSQFHGSISARGGVQSGNGGLVEVSGKENLIYRGSVDVGATQGTAGSILLDPDRIFIVSGSGEANDAALSGGGIFAAETDADGIFTISETALESLTGTVTLQANDGITLQNLTDNRLTMNGASSITFEVGGGTSGTFRMDDPNDTIETQTGNIAIAARFIDLSNLSSNGGNITLAVPNNGEISLNGNSTISTGAGVGGDITINGVVEGNSFSPRSLTLSAGAGNVSVVGGIGQDAAVGSRGISQLSVSGKDVLLDSQFFTTPFSADGTVNVQAAGNLALGFATDIRGGSTVTLVGQGGIEMTETSLTAGQALTVQTPGVMTFTNRNRLQSGTDLTVQANSLEANSGDQLTLDAGQNLSVQTQADLNLTPIQLMAAGNTSVRSLEGSIQLGNQFTPNTFGGDLTLQAANDITLQQAQLNTLGNLTLLANGTVTMQDGGKPAILTSDGNLTIQGNSAIAIQGYRNSDSRVQSGGNLTLRSNGPIQFDAQFSSGGSFLSERVSGGAANLQSTVPSFNSLISAAGDVTFGNYEGVSLKIESGGSITGGNIAIFGANSTLVGADPDIALLSSRPTLILRAGVTSLQNPPNLPPNRTVGGTPFTASGSASTPASIQVGAINTGAGGVGGPVILSAPGNIQIGNINTTGFADPGNDPVTLTAGSAIQTGNITNQGSDIQLTAVGNIRAGDIDSNGFGNGSSVSLTSTAGNIQISTIDTGSGGIDIRAAGTFQAIGSFTNGFSGGGGLENDPGLIAYLESLGFARADLLAATVRIPSAQARVSLIARPSTVSPSGYKAPITIQIGDASVPIIDQTYPVGSDLGRVLVLGDSRQAFRLGPVFNNNTVYVPLNALDQVADYNPTTNNFAFTLNGSRALNYGTTEFPSDASGAVGGIAIGEGTDSSFYGSFQSRIFTPTDLPSLPNAPAPGVPPTQPAPPSLPNAPAPGVPPTQLAPPSLSNASAPGVPPTQSAPPSPPQAPVGQEVEQAANRRQLATCTPTGVATEAAANQRDRSNTSPQDPCVSPTDDAQILKILGEPVTPPPQSLAPKGVSALETSNLVEYQKR